MQRLNNVITQRFSGPARTDRVPRDFNIAVIVGAACAVCLASAITIKFRLFDPISSTIERHPLLVANILIVTLAVVAALLLLLGYRRQQDIGREITERLVAEQTANEQLRLAGVAVNNISQGLCMYDASARVVFCNDRYRQIWGLSADIVRPGISLRELLTHQRDLGNFDRDIDAYVDWLRGRIAVGESTEHLVALADDRWLRLLQTPLGDGGWVATHEDVTAQRRAEIERDNTKNFLQTVIEHVPATILVKDARDFRYILLNRAGHNFFSLGGEDILGKTAHEFFPKNVADAITARDLDLLEKGHQSFEEDHPIHRNNKEVMHIASERLVIRGLNGEPQYLLGVIVDVTERRQAEAKITHIAQHDALTGLANRAHFLNSAHKHLEQARREGSPFNILMIDLDGFKSVNDSLGHPIGDTLLKAVAGRLKDCVREADLVARLGGDEFVILQTAREEQREQAADLARRVLKIVSAPYDVAGHQAIIGASIGIALAPADGSTADELLKKADLALYKAKYKGRDGFRFFQAEMESEARARHALQNDLHDALARNEFELHYQTIFDVGSGRPCGAEALVRWRHSERGLVSPGEFIPLAEEIGLIIPLGEWILRQACADAASWPSDIKLAVNLSPAQFRSSNLPDIVSAVLTDSGLPAGRLELEITESVLLHKDADNLGTLDRLKALGISIVLDDFGTGYSSLSYLQMFPFDKIKIDRSFVNEISSRADSATIVSAVIGIGKGLQALTTAEGVETEEQLILLRTAGVDQVQGYLLSHPVPIAQLQFEAVNPDRTGIAA
jgi:diguanylate cyclase (GGDEF)-like protein/PAS domain S-box-containing protein